MNVIYIYTYTHTYTYIMYLKYHAHCVVLFGLLAVMGNSFPGKFSYFLLISNCLFAVFFSQSNNNLMGYPEVNLKSVTHVLWVITQLWSKNRHLIWNACVRGYNIYPLKLSIKQLSIIPNLMLPVKLWVRGVIYMRSKR